MNFLPNALLLLRSRLQYVSQSEEQICGMLLTM